VAKLLPKLQKLRIVPPEVRVPNVQVTIPKRDIRVLSGLTTSNCSNPVKICAQPNGVSLGINFSANPLDVLRPEQQCAANGQLTVGCADPPFGLVPTFTTITIPDPVHAKVSWSGGSFNLRSAEIDLTKPELEVTCTRQNITCPTLPKLKVTEATVETGVCLSPQFRPVVAHP